MNTESFGKVSCNGLIVINNGEAIVFDTPTNNEISQELIDWIETETHSKLKAVVITHHHEDCLGGLDEFHRKQIPSYANNATIDLAISDSVSLPENGFEDYLELEVGNTLVMNEFSGEGHTADNIISYFPDENVLFGGCLIKAVGAGKGYLGDANVKEWPNTVKKIKAKYKDAVFIIPGHGDAGSQELLDFTIGLFESSDN